MEELTSFQRDILHVIAGLDRPHGLAVKHELEDYYGDDINHGRLYPNMDQLSEQGLVNKSKRDERSNTYVITELGKKMLAHRHHWEKSYFKPSAKLNAAVRSD